MQLHTLTTTHFRNLQDNANALTFSPHLNFIYGENGSGKTGLLEAIYFLGRGKSFRENKSRHIIAYDAPYFRLLAELQHAGQMHRLGIERAVREYTIRLDGEDLGNLGELAQLMPVQIINAEHFSLISEGPEYRRQFMDYGLFYDTPDFYPLWRKYQYALKNRNAALRENWQSDYFKPWHAMLEQYALKIDQLRNTYLQLLTAKLNHFHAELGGLEALELRYQRGWSGDKPLGQLLAENLERDRQLKHTRDGIHRAEWRIYAAGKDIAHSFSRGQQKTVICALMLAQSERIGEVCGKRPLILVDDIAAELDEKRQRLLLDFLIASQSQLFITSILPPTQMPPESVCFSIAEGRLQRVP